MSTTKERNSDGERRPYQAPMVLDSAPFETLALSCGKKPGDSDENCGPYGDPGQS